MSLLERHELAHLLDWAGREGRKPLVIRGGRQVGKSTLVREFARVSGMRVMDINLERDPKLEQAFATNDPAEILSTLTLMTGQPNRVPARNAAEVNYLLAIGRRVVPVEIKAGTTGSLRSLHQFLAEKRSDFGIRLNADVPSLLHDARRLSDGSSIEYRLLSLPLYLVGQLRRLAVECVESSHAGDSSGPVVPPRATGVDSATFGG